MQYGRYKVIKELGKGAMGVVYQAHDPKIDRLVALKVLREDRLSSEYYVQRFFKEAKAIGRLSHANIVTVYDVGQDQDTIYIAMEFLEGRSLDEVINERKLTLEEIVDIGVQLARALGYAHRKGIIHRDVKPTNIIITPENHAKITDFGIARIEDPSAAQQTQTGEILGTPFFMSPEQVKGKIVDGRADLYSLGVFLYRISTGKKAFEGNNLAAIFQSITQDTPLEPFKVDPSIPESLSDLIMKSIRKNPDERFQSGEEMADALKNCLQPDHTEVMQSAQPDVNEYPTDEPPIKNGKDRKRLKVAAVCITGSLSVWLAYAVISPKIEPPSSISPPTHSISTAIPPTSVPEKVVRGKLEICSIPENASVFVDGVVKGSTPLTLELPFGKYEIRISADNYFSYAAQVTLSKPVESICPRLVSMSDDLL